MKIITTISYHGTGSGAVDDFLKEFDNCAYAASEYECRLLQDPDGISDLEYNLVENYHRLNTGYALKRYLNFVQHNVRTYRRIFGPKWVSYSKDYVDALTKFRYKGYWHGDLLLLNPIQFYWYHLKRKLNKLLPKKLQKSNYHNYFPEMETLHVSITEQEFLEKTHQYMGRLCKLINPEKKEYVLFDQLVPTTNVDRYLRYVPGLKVIVVDRDPRDLYINQRRIGEHVLPAEPYEYCKFYRDIRKNREELYHNKNVLFLRFEDLIFHYEEKTKEIMEFTGETKAHHVRARQNFKPEVSINNTQIWKKNKAYEKEISIIEKELKEYLYDFSRNE